MNTGESLNAIVARFVATAGGAGLVPKAPGTAGAVVGLAFAWATHSLSFTAQIAIIALISAIGTWSAKRLDELDGTSDNQKIVIDEVAGQMITCLGAPLHGALYLISFALFRFFDIVKPPPVRQIDTWSKHKASNRSDPKAALWGGFGVMADDLAAGVMALLARILIERFFFA